MAKITYDYKIISKIGKKIPLEKIQTNYFSIFSELKDQECELFLAPHKDARVIKIKDENELKKYLTHTGYKPKNLEFYSIPKNAKLASQREVNKIEKKETTEPENNFSGSDAVYYEILKKMNNQ